ncbi:MAG: TraX family protein [Filifactoraceae bacterium]
MISNPKYSNFSLNITKIKLIALATMFMDHVGAFIPNMPFIFRIIGRISAPLFLFAATEGFYNTSCKKRYMLRLYALNVIMGVINLSLDIEFNFIRTLLFVCIIIHIHENNKMLLFIATQSLLLISSLFLEYMGLGLGAINFFNTLCVSFVNIEGGLIYVILGLTMYKYRDKKDKFVFSFFIFMITEVFVMNTNCLFVLGRNLGESSEVVYFIMAQIIGVNPMDLNNPASILIAPQWMMLSSLIVICLYNGTKGKGYKHLFYLFYPLHILLLYFIGRMFGVV